MGFWYSLSVIGFSQLDDFALSIGVYCNRLYVYGKRHSPFSRHGRITANTIAKELHITNIDIKGCPPKRKIGLP